MVHGTASGSGVGWRNGSLVDPDRHTVDIPITAGARQSLALLGSFQAAGANIEDFQLRRPTLDDVFLTLTGAPAKPDHEADKEMAR
jgi:ABC-2 type transport system ATP-binding protein